MRWTKKETEYLKENYSKNPEIWDIRENLNKSIKAIHHKAARLGISRKNFSKRKKMRKSRSLIDKDYYNKNKKEIYKRKKERIDKKRKELKMLLGGKCSICGYNKCINALEFHHDKGKKEEVLSILIKDYSKQKSLKEIRKCILLCANCHRELHAGL